MVSARAATGPRTPSVERSRPALVLAAWVLAGTELVHGFVPTAGEVRSESPLGFYAGILLVLTTLVAAVGLSLHRDWAVPLAGWTGFVVAAGFALYHATPAHTPFTNPYPGEPVGLPAWAALGVAIAAGVWCGVEGRRARKAGHTPV